MRTSSSSPDPAAVAGASRIGGTPPAAIVSPLLHGAVGPTLVRLSIPMIWGMLTMLLFSVVDAFFIAMLGSEPLAAIGYTLPVIMVVTGAAMGLGVGMASMISRAAGQGLSRRVAILTTHGMLLTILVGLVIIVGGLTWHDTLFRLIGAEEPMLPLIRHYMFPWFIGAAFLIVPMVGNSAIRATGDTFTPSLIMVIAGGVNAVLDPLLIFGIGPFPRLELQGAALATSGSYLIACAAALYVLVHRRGMVVLEWPMIPRILASWRRLLPVALPAIGSNLLVPLASGLLIWIVARHGEQAVATFGVGMRITALAMVAPLALATVMTAYTGQNAGARRPDRVRDGLRFARQFCVVVGLVQWAVLAFFSGPIACWFTDDPLIVAGLRPFLMWVPLSFAGFGYMLSVASSFSASGRPLYSVILFVARLFVFTVPLALWGSRVAGVQGIYAAIFIGNIGSGLLAHVLKLRVFEADTRRSGSRERPWSLSPVRG